METSASLRSTATILLWLQAALIVQVYCTFSHRNAFELSSHPRYPNPGDDVTLRCQRKQSRDPRTVAGFRGRDDNVSWEENGLTVLTTGIDDTGGCNMIKDNIFTLRHFQGDTKRLSQTSCTYDGTNIALTIRRWTPLEIISGDRWRCLQFPFKDSRTLKLQTYVPVRSVSIRQRIDTNLGTVVSCVTSSSRPQPQVFWYIKGVNDTSVKVTKGIEETVSKDTNGMSIKTSSLVFSKDEDHGVNVYCRSVNQHRMVGKVRSDVVTLEVKYPPSINIHVIPGASIFENTDVTLSCSVTGRPTPTVKWIRKTDDSSSPGGDDHKTRVISVDRVLSLKSITVKDSGEYTCVASNNISRKDKSVVLFVRERSSMSDDTSSTVESNSDSDTATGAIAGATIAIIIFLTVIAVIVILYLRNRWGKHHSIVGCGQRDSISHGDGQGIYTTCASLSRNSDLLTYIDVLPPAYTTNQKLYNITNPGYEVVDNVIDCINSNPPQRKGKRPLPSTPAHPPQTDYGYEEIDDEVYSTTNRPSRQKDECPNSATTLPIRDFRVENGGYEVPVSPKLWE